MAQGARGLKINADPADLQLVIRGGEMIDAPLQDCSSWILGGYEQKIGRVSARGKEFFGLYIPLEVEDEGSVSML